MLHIFGVVLNLLYIFGLCSSQVSMKPIYVNESYLIPRVVNGYEAALGDVPYQVLTQNLGSFLTIRRFQNSKLRADWLAP